ncbi:MAG TPA: 1,2-phenylacetyl-CoA epoxidase subunit PaaD [Casimicrobiaceae bacterium]|nr:1,2-phenylacetyl-CoA epoxidase subunit PaaD [Casimicrobiaceae bacterium]
MPSSLEEGGRADGASAPSLSDAWRVLGEVTDPEIPVVSVVELGILRGVRWDADDSAVLVVTVTPTYSGCPATEMIATAICTALSAAGFARVRIETSLVPAWTTEWITPEGARKLREFGIAPPDRSRTLMAGVAVAIDTAGIRPLRRSKVVVACPRCASKRTELVSQFGSTACKAQYRCLDCLEPFDYFKPH